MHLAKIYSTRRMYSQVPTKRGGVRGGGGGVLVVGGWVGGSGTAF